MNDARRSFVKLLGATTLAMSSLSSAELARAATGPDQGGVRWGMVVDLRLCIGCQACTVGCTLENQVPLGNFRTLVSSYEVSSGGAPRRATLPRLCNHCAKPACVTVCPTQATTKRPDGAVVVDSSICIGCGYCVQACPYDARFINEKTKTADKCTFCLHRLEAGLLPACVETCVTGARVFGDLHDPQSAVSKLLQRYPVQVLKKEMGTEPRVFYIGLDESLSDRVHGRQVLVPAGESPEMEEM
ncbi:MAG: 4Fe-4S dicluster domain-containing protein [Desulfobulbaceae bacterium]|jgi:tetrathionate reductase subunit B|nr:4Fe-4S dicluster domain-containing protein [Desulfobulbaceae bacterium]